MHLKVISIAGLVFAFTLALTGCTASSTKSSAGGAAHGEALTADAPVASASAAAKADSGAGASNGNGPVLVNRSVIVTASITVRTDDIHKAVNAVETVAGEKGGVVYAEDVDLTPKQSDEPGNASATVTVKVPTANADETLDAIAKIGTEVARSKDSQDVTTKVVDVNARIDAARASIARLTELMNHAGSVADLLSVENQLSQRDADLESLEQQQDSLKAQTSSATITVHLEATPPVVAAAHVSHKPGFVRGLVGGWHAFTATASAFFTGLGAALPFLAVVGVLAAAIFFGRRKLRARRPQES